ncbi:AarF/ABC1/UbiB kinase family protein [Caloramator sp. ALD01]|uniref:ABC1 kinase family protein n=1 Tax=Caloramator sp. ALD01 TaxID=1031288 RepID=UPI00041C68D2|nr:AarF/ABC1/UbiB kinase family protein [Caloramator sp. ALD01]
MVKKNTLHRFREIVKILAKYGFGYIVDSKIKNQTPSPENLRRAFEELGPTFIKIGQILSTRPDILPYEYIKELERLQDNVMQIPFEEINDIFTQEFGVPLNRHFSYFEKKPLASASIAQVHRAKLLDGKEVIVKFQRPNIEENMKLDIEILKRILRFTNAKFNDALINPKEALSEIEEATKKELNFINEAKALDKFYNNNINVKFVSCPYVYWDLTTKRILTMEYIDGIKIDNIENLMDEGYDLEDLGKKLALSYFKQIFADGFFHGDPHPGNLIVKDNKIYYIDFGIVGCFSKSMKESLNEVILSIAFRDIDKMISALLNIGIKKGYINRSKLYEDIDYLFVSYLTTSLENLKISQMLEEIFEVAKRNNIRLPKDLTLLIRGLVILEGVVAKISPNIKILDIAIPFVKEQYPSKIFPNFNDLIFEIINLNSQLKSLPHNINKLLNNVNAGRTKVQLEHKNLSKPIHELNKMVNRLVFAIITSSLIIGSSLILNTNIGPKIYGISILGVTGYIVAGILGLWILISILRSGKI